MFPIGTVVSRMLRDPFNGAIRGRIDSRGSISRGFTSADSCDAAMSEHRCRAVVAYRQRRLFELVEQLGEFDMGGT